MKTVTVLKIKVIVLSILIVLTIGAMTLFIWVLRASDKKGNGERIHNLAVVAVELQKLGEAAYFEGQYDYMHGNIKIKKVNGKYYWTKSPWADGKDTVYKPEEEWKGKK